MKNMSRRKRHSVSCRLMVLFVMVWAIVVAIGISSYAVEKTEYEDINGFRLTITSGASNVGSITCSSDTWEIVINGKSDNCGDAENVTVNFKLENTGKKTDGTVRPVNFKLTTTKTSSVYTNEPMRFDSSNNSIELSANNNQGKGKTLTVTIRLFDIVQESLGEKVTTTFKQSAGGSYTVDDSDVENNTGLTNSDDYTYTLVAEPSAGYKLYGWMSSIGVLDTSGATTFLYTGKNTATIWPLFIKTDSAVYYIQGSSPMTYYGFFDDALEAAGTSGTVVVYKSGTLYGSTGQTSFTITADQRLLIPYAASDVGNFGSLDDGDTAMLSSSPCTVYCTLTIPSDTRIDCYGDINVNGQRRVDSQGATGTGNPRGNHGLMKLTGTGNQLQIWSGGALYCYGFISGTGSVEVFDGGKIHEFMQVYDWPGGTNMMGWAPGAVLSPTDKLFFSSRYFLQNVEAPLKVNYGGEMYFEAGLTASKKMYYTSSMLVGSTGLFKNSSGTYITRQYDPSTDRVAYYCGGTGTITLGSIIVSASGYELDSSKFILPLNSALTITIGDGVSLNLSNRFALCPATELIIEKGGTLNLTNHLYLFDKSEWTQATNLTFGDGIAPLYTVGRGTTKKLSIDKSAQLVIDGTLNISGNGGLFTSSTGTSADKIVRGSGQIIHNGKTGSQTIKGGYSSSRPSVSFVDAYGLLCGISQNETDLKSFENNTYYGLGEGFGNFWYTHRIEFQDEGSLVDTLYYIPTDDLPYGDVSMYPILEDKAYDDGYIYSRVWQKYGDMIAATTDPVASPYYIFVPQMGDITGLYSTLDLDYRLNDYIWMNATVTIPASGKAELVDDYGGTIQLVKGNDGTYYLVRKVLSTDLTTEFKVTLSIDGIETEVLDLSFTTFANGLGQDHPHKALVNAMINYGKAADDYFPDADTAVHFDKTFTFAEICVATGDRNPSDSMKGLLPARNEYNGVKLKTAGATIDFANCLGMVLRFKTTDKLVLEEGDSIAQIGFMIGTNAKYMATDGTAVELTDESYDDAFIYFGKTDGTVNGSDNIIQGINGAVSGVVGNVPADLSQEMRLRFDMTKDQYLTRFAMRPFIVILRKDGTYLNLYGEQVLYGFEDYCARIDAKTTSSQQSKNLVVYAWKYALEAARAKFEGE